MDIKRIMIDFTNEKNAIHEIEKIIYSDNNFNCGGICCRDCPFHIKGGCIIGTFKDNIDGILKLIEDYENNIW